MHWQDDNQFRYWGIYPLFAFVCCTVVFQVTYLNKALAYFSTSIVTPLNFVFFSTFTLVTSAVLYQGFNVQSPIEALTILCGFFVIVIGVALLFQYNLKLNKLSQVRWIEDINTLEGEEESEQNPFQVMRDNFPFHPEAKVVPKTYVRSLAAQPAPDLAYMRSDLEAAHQGTENVYTRETVEKEQVRHNQLVPLIPLISQLHPGENK
jgi:hypothetical protein